MGTREGSSPIDHESRNAVWEQALQSRSLPTFVKERLEKAAAGRQPWISTMTAAELLLTKTHGIRPLATVSGTCWFHYGQSWTEGHEEGWSHALHRIRREAVACGANAVVDVRMRTLRHNIGSSMDFTLFGTAIRIQGLQPNPEPVIATVPALEFVRLLEMGIVPTGIAVGARYAWLDQWTGSAMGGSWSTRPWGTALQQTEWSSRSLFNEPLGALTDFWEGIRREAHAALRRNASQFGNGVLAHTHFGEIFKQDRDKQPAAYLGRHIVVGTVIETETGSIIPHEIEPVIDMRDDLSPLSDGSGTRHTSYEGDLNDEEGMI